FAIFFVVSSSATQEPNPPSQPPVMRPGDALLAGAGVVEPTTQNISVGSPLPGVVTWVIPFDQVGKTLKKGTELLKLDDTPVQADLKVRKAALLIAKKQLDKLLKTPREEEIESMELRVEEIKVGLVEAKFLFEANDKLYKQKPPAVSLEVWGKSKKDYETLKV